MQRKWSDPRQGDMVMIRSDEQGDGADLRGDHEVTAGIVPGTAASAELGTGRGPAGATESGRPTLTVTARRRSRLGAVLAAVVAVAGIAVAIRIISGGSSRPLSGSANVWMAPSAPAIPAGSQLIRHPSVPVVSPITIGGAAPTMNALDWTSTTDSLTVQWDVQGIVQSATTSSDEPPGPSPTVASAGHGYVVDALPRSARSNTPVTVGGHPAVMSVGAPAVDSGILSDRWTSWRLHDGRYVHAWSAGASVDELTRFTGDLAERNQVLPRRILLGVSLPGLTAEAVHHGNDPTVLNLDQITLCPTTQSPQDQSEQAVDRCIRVGIAHGESIDQSIGMMGGGGETLTVGGQKIYTAGNSAYVHVDNKNGPFGINVWSPDRKPQDLALIASSVRFDPTMATGS